MPAPALEDLVAPAHTALVTQECQSGVVGAQSARQELADEARREAVPNIARLVTAARSAGVTVVHCTAAFRADRRGANHNARLFGSGRGAPRGEDFAAVLPELGPEPSDLVLPRLHGLGPMGGTELDPILRNLGVSTIVGVGVSVNVAMTNFVMDAVNAAYQFVLPTDAVAGIPRQYAEAVIENTLSLLATLTTTDELVKLWS